MRSGALTMSPMLDHDSVTSSTPSTPPKIEIERLQREHDAMQAALDELRSLLGGLVETVEAIALRNLEERNVLQRKLVASVGTFPQNLDSQQASPVMTGRVEQDSGEPDVLGLFASEFDASSSALLGLLSDRSTTGPAITVYQPPASEHRRLHPQLLAHVVRPLRPAVDLMRRGRGWLDGVARRVHDLRVRSESPQPRRWTLKLHGLRIALLVVASMAMTAMTWVGIKAGYPVSRSLIPLSPLTRSARTEAQDGRKPPSRSADRGAPRLLPASKTAAPGTAAPAGQMTASAQDQSTRSKTVPVPVARAALSSAPNSSSVAEARGPSSRRVDTPPRIVSKFVGSLVIESQPSGADVFVDRGRVGMSPIRLSRLRAGSHTVRIDLDGYERWSRAVAVVTNQSTRITAMMERDP
jgi:hypothetical protein